MPSLTFTKLTKCIYKTGSLMKVEIKGLRSKKKSKILAEAAEFYASILMRKRTVDNLDVTLNVKKSLDNGVEGYCNFVEIDDGIKYFEIEIKRSESMEDLLLSLAHEMVHLKQYAIGELKSDASNRQCSIWQKKSVNEKRIDYWDLPWEIEAFGREKGLYYRFCERTGYML